jgi:hypothetical protein
MPARTKKHLTKKERQSFEASKRVTRKDTFYMVNQLIDEHECPDLQQAVEMLQKVNDRVGISRRVVVCFHCARRIGVRRCSGCPDSPESRYCSLECQRASWPSHKLLCGGRSVIDVD